MHTREGVRKNLLQNVLRKIHEQKKQQNKPVTKNSTRKLSDGKMLAKCVVNKLIRKMSGDHSNGASFTHSEKWEDSSVINTYIIITEWAGTQRQ